jgi:hypothetical protein
MPQKVCWANLYSFTCSINVGACQFAFFGSEVTQDEV